MDTNTLINSIIFFGFIAFVIAAHIPEWMGDHKHNKRRRFAAKHTKEELEDYDRKELEERYAKNARKHYRTIRRQGSPDLVNLYMDLRRERNPSFHDLGGDLASISGGAILFAFEKGAAVKIRDNPEGEGFLLETFPFIAGTHASRPEYLSDRSVKGLARDEEHLRAFISKFGTLSWRKRVGEDVAVLEEPSYDPEYVDAFFEVAQEAAEETELAPYQQGANEDFAVSERV